jgi:pSer/pThr/pTyr-binding forkhead associated (FHA) protein
MAGSPKFTVLHEKFRGKTFLIDQETMSIGRRDGVDIQLKDSSLSGHHADIIRGERDGRYVYILRDNDSTNGTRINNIQITEQELKNNDLILFGGIEVLFDGDSDSSSGNAFNQNTHTIDLSSIDTSMSTVHNMSSLNPFAEKEAKKHDIVNRIMIAVAVLCGTVAIAAALKFIFKVHL